MQHEQKGASQPIVIRVTGELDMDRAQALRVDLEKAIEAAPGSAAVTVDLSDLTFCDSSGLNVLLGARLHAQEAGHVLRLAGPPRQVLNLLEMTGAITLFPIDRTPPT
ncbi:STAS domain-containing protein [Streptomyces uncialis]|uniref:STAS domain-containing protein n=1 Tax=Streptomyces uncialis TaxID=1048205 RepID=UPI00386D562F|nr:STAS domain-containing protein [Streptomyces uncialis]